MASLRISLVPKNHLDLPRKIACNVSGISFRKLNAHGIQSNLSSWNSSSQEFLSFSRRKLISSVPIGFQYSKTLRMQQSLETVAHSSSATQKVSEPIGEHNQVEGGMVVNSNDLLVVGPGVLGTLVAQAWKKEFPEAIVTGQTRTTSRHAELASLGIQPVVRDSEASNLSEFPFVIFCAPPGGNEDYVGEVKAAVKRWNGKGALLFTSSSGLYQVNDNGPCYEDSPVVPLGGSPRTDRLLQSEAEVLTAGGSVVRLAGLYLLNRGAHTFWLSKGSVDARPDHFLNLIHYEDAAALAVAALKSKLRGKIFLGCDNHPVTRQEVMDATVKSGKFEGTFQGFTVSEGPLGKKMSNDRTRAELKWEPKYRSFGSFLGVE